MNRTPKPTKQERQIAANARAKQRLHEVVDRCRKLAASDDPTTPKTEFERAALALLKMYHNAPTDEVVDASIAMTDITAKGQGLSIEQAVNALVGMCADDIRREALKAEMDEGVAQRLRLLFGRAPTAAGIIARSAEFDHRVAILAKEDR